MPIALFNGKDLSGWTTWLTDTKEADPRGVFSVKQGRLRISGDGRGCIATKQAFRDYRLVVEFEWGEKNYGDRATAARDSGIFLHAQGPAGNSEGGASRSAIECDLKQGAAGDLLLITGKAADGSALAAKATVAAAAALDREQNPTFMPGGAPRAVAGPGRVNWLGKDAAWQDRVDFRGAGDLESRHREWTQVECICQGDRIRVFVGGTLVNEVSGVSQSAGPILLQCDGSEILFRRVELLPLDAAPLDRATSDYCVRNLSGWTVHVNRKLLDKPDLAARTCNLLSAKLDEIRRMLPQRCVAELAKIPFWLELADPRMPCACYHISPAWLAQHGYSVDKAGAVELANAENFLSWTKQQPWMVLHELTHGYHDRVLGHDYAPLRACFDDSIKSKRYESVLDFAGRRRKAYAATNVEEYFAEATEAFFGTNDFYPFVRPELREHDPALFKALQEIWKE
jgi:hypothetical protein